MTDVLPASGFSAAFHKRYPFYTTLGIVDDDVLQSGGHQVSYPNEQVVQHLGITHIVNATTDVDNDFAGEGIKYFNAAKPEANIARFLDAAFEFLTCIRVDS